jgi:hypothetical protein
MNALSQFSEPQKIEILLHEYDALRNEIDGRTRDGFNLFGTVGALFIGALTLIYNKVGFVWFLIVAIGGLITFAVATRETFFRIRRAAERLREIEGLVNSRIGEELLVWERRYGGAGHGWFLQSLGLRGKSNRPKDEKAEHQASS